MQVELLNICSNIRSRGLEIQNHIDRLLFIRDHWETVSDADVAFFKEVIGIGLYRVATGSFENRKVVIVTPNDTSPSVLIDLDNGWVGVASPAGENIG